MEKFFSLQYGVAGICVLLTIHVLIYVGEFLWKIREKKETISDLAVKDLTSAMYSNTSATRHLDNRLQHLERTITDLPKFKTDLRRFYAAIKEVAGDKWPKIRDEIMKDEFTQ